MKKLSALILIVCSIAFTSCEKEIIKPMKPGEKIGHSNVTSMMSC